MAAPPEKSPFFSCRWKTTKRSDSKAFVDYFAFVDRVVDNVLNKLRATFVIELTTADHNGSDSIVVEPLHVVIDVGLHGT